MEEDLGETKNTDVVIEQVFYAGIFKSHAVSSNLQRELDEPQQTPESAIPSYSWSGYKFVGDNIYKTKVSSHHFRGLS